MAETIVSTSNQNFIKTLLAVLIGVLIVVPLTTFLTFLVINSQMGVIADNIGQRLANVGPVQTINTDNDKLAGLTGVDPDAKADQKAQATNPVKSHAPFGYLWGYSSTSNTNISNTTTTTNTSTVSIWDNGNTTTDNRNS